MIYGADKSVDIVTLGKPGLAFNMASMGYFSEPRLLNRALHAGAYYNDANDPRWSALNDDGSFNGTQPGTDTTATKLIMSVWQSHWGTSFRVRWSGSATLATHGTYTIDSQTAGQATITKTAGTSMAISFNVSNWADPVVILDIVNVDHLALYDGGEVFEPLPEAIIPACSVLRFMDWGRTNNNPLANWADRPLITAESFTGRKGKLNYYGGPSSAGLPLELMIDYANKHQVAPWFCIPVQATDDYVVQMAQLIKDRLDPELYVIMEYSNEVWNTGAGFYNSFAYCRDMAWYTWGPVGWTPAAGYLETQTGGLPGSAWLNYQSFRSTQIMMLMEPILGHRLRGTLGSQHFSPSSLPSVLDAALWASKAAEGRGPAYINPCDHHHSLTTGGYFYSNQKPDGTAFTKQMLWDFLAVNDTAGALAQMNLNAIYGLTVSEGYMAQHAAGAKSRGLDYYIYETNQHDYAVPYEWGTADGLTQADADARNVIVLELFRQWVFSETMATRLTESLTMHKKYASIIAFFADWNSHGRYGTWCIAENPIQSTPNKTAVLGWGTSNPRDFLF